MIQEVLRRILSDRSLILSGDHRQFLHLFSEALDVESAKPVTVPILQKSQACSRVKKGPSSLKMHFAEYIIL